MFNICSRIYIIIYTFFFASFTDGLTDCEDPECCEDPVCQKSQLCHSVPQPIDILLRKQPPSLTASFFERMKFIIEDKGLQSYVQRAGFNERCVHTLCNVVVHHFYKCYLCTLSLTLTAKNDSTNFPFSKVHTIYYIGIGDTGKCSMAILY